MDEAAVAGLLDGLPGAGPDATRRVLALILAGDAAQLTAALAEIMGVVT